MSKSEIRIPKQQRSIEKKERILKAGYEIFCEKGYHSTNTVEIAKRAGVATGSVYSYFKDKKSIFLAILDLYAEEISGGVLSELEKLDSTMDLYELLHNIIKISIQSHNITKDAHEEMQAMSHSDKDVSNYFYEFRSRLVKKLVEILGQHGIHPAHAEEKIILAYNVIEDLCHEIVYYKSESVNYEVMVREAVTMIIHLLTKENSTSF